MKLSSFPSRYTPSLPPEDGNAYRVVWQRLGAKVRTLSTLCYSTAGWVMRDANGRWVGFSYLDSVIAHNPCALEEAYHVDA